MGRPIGLIWLMLVLAALAGAPGAAANPWLGHRVMNIAHQGGEDEAPSNTMYAYRRALALGADMLEIDVHSTADGRLVVLHDATVDRTTQGSGSVYDLTLEEVQGLDAAHDFVAGEGARGGRPAGDYPLRGVRTGQRPAPDGSARDDFRIPSLEEVLRAHPEVPINIEIKGRADLDQGSFVRNAELLAALLGRIGRTEGLIVTSFSDLALARFHALAPQVGLAPATVAVARFKLGIPPGGGSVAFQVPITLGPVQVTDAAFVAQAHRRGYAVHVWLSNDAEDRATYERLLGWGVDGIMAARPAALEALLCERATPRPAFGFARHCAAPPPAFCTARAVGAGRAGPRGSVRVRLARDGGLESPCRGTIALTVRRGGGARPLSLARGRFRIAPGRRVGSVQLRLGRPGRQLVQRRGTLRVVAVVRASGAAAARTAPLRLRAARRR